MELGGTAAAAVIGRSFVFVVPVRRYRYYGHRYGLGEQRNGTAPWLLLLLLLLLLPTTTRTLAVVIETREGHGIHQDQDDVCRIPATESSIPTDGGSSIILSPLGAAHGLDWFLPPCGRTQSQSRSRSGDHGML